MKSKPPKVSKKWTPAERLSVVGWISQISLDRISRDNPNMPALAKKPVHDVFVWLDMLATATPSVLESWRSDLLKPYDSSKDHNGVEVLVIK